MRKIELVALVMTIALLLGALIGVTIQRNNVREEVKKMESKYNEERFLTNLVREELKKKEAEVDELKEELEIMEQKADCVVEMADLVLDCLNDTNGVYDIFDLSEEEIMEMTPEQIIAIERLKTEVLFLIGEYTIFD